MVSKYIYYILFPLFYLGIAMLGGYFTSLGVTTWYPAIAKPFYTPPGSFIGAVWTIIYTLSSISLILFVNAAQGKSLFWPVIGLYILNGILNALWSYIFFTKHMLFLAVLDAFFIWITVGLMIVYVWRYSILSGLLLFPYLLWVFFATFLTAMIYKLN